MTADDIRSLESRHRAVIGAVLRGDKEVHQYQMRALVRHGYAVEENGHIRIAPELEAAYRERYQITTPRRRMHRTA